MHGLDDLLHLIWIGMYQTLRSFKLDSRNGQTVSESVMHFTGDAVPFSSDRKLFDLFGVTPQLVVGDLKIGQQLFTAPPLILGTHHCPAKKSKEHISGNVRKEVDQPGYSIHGYPGYSGDQGENHQPDDTNLDGIIHHDLWTQNKEYNREYCPTRVEQDKTTCQNRLQGGSHPIPVPYAIKPML